MKDGCPRNIHIIRDRNGDKYAYQNNERGGHYVAARDYWLPNNTASAHQDLLDLGWKNQKRVKVYFEEMDDFRVITPEEAQLLLLDEDNRNLRKGELMVHFGKRPNIPKKKYARLEDFEGGG